MTITISVTEAARNFSDLINRVNYQGQTFLLTRGGKVVARLTGAERMMTGAEFFQWWEQRPRLDPEDAEQWGRELVEDRAAIPPPESPYMGLLIDSSIWIAGERHQINLPELLSRYSDEPLAISAVSASELLHGLHRAQDSRRAQRDASS